MRENFYQLAFSYQNFFTKKLGQKQMGFVLVFHLLLNE